MRTARAGGAECLSEEEEGKKKKKRKMPVVANEFLRIALKRGEERRMQFNGRKWKELNDATW